MTKRKAKEKNKMEKNVARWLKKKANRSDNVKI